MSCIWPRAPFREAQPQVPQRLDDSPRQTPSGQGERLLREGRFAEAAYTFEQALPTDPSNPALLTGLATALSMSGDMQRSIELCRKAIASDPTYIRSYGILGGIYQRLGRFDEAVACAESAIALKPELSKPYAEIIRCKRITSDDSNLLDTLERMFADPARPAAEKYHLGLALGKAYDDLGLYDRAMQRFDLANEIARNVAGSLYDPEAREREVETIEQTFKSLTYARSESSRPPIPLLIVGMIRSGTTLLDSLLCRSSQIASAGELRFWEDRTTSLFRSGRGARGSRRDIEALAREYRSHLASIGPTAKFVIDKMPMNYRFLGFILHAVPEAKVIHLRRQPVDTCISIYTSDFGPRPPGFAFDRANIAHAYRMYLRLMERWRRSIPGDSMIEIDYETLVESTEGALRAVRHFIGQADHEGRSQSHGDDVRTPSRWQARQPVYTSSVGRWKNYPEWTKEFKAFLGGT